MSPADKETCNQELRRAGARIDPALEVFLTEAMQGPTSRMYGMLAYFMGFLDEKFDLTKVEAGRRFRSALSLYIAESYGAAENKTAFDAALSIELFHNFTLIHDDVEDRDEMRRNRPTVWKLWGVNHAINSGDAQSLIVSQLALRAARDMPELGEALFAAFLEVIEGQYLDFELADAKLDGDFVNEKNYLLMVEKKSGVLVRIAAEASGIATKQSDAERELLRQYGVSLGIAYQMTDDYNSVWSGSDMTGKDLMSDIREHKRTLPFLYAREHLDAPQKKRLEELYSLPRQLTDAEVKEAHAVLDTKESKEYVRSRMNEYAEKAKKAAENLAIPQQNKAILAGIVDMLTM